MKKIFYIFLFLTIVACKSSYTLTNADNLPFGKYCGNIAQYQVFVLVNNDTVIVDWILIDKFPRDLFTDTLFISSNGKSKWQGKFSLITKEGKRIYVQAPNFFFQNELLRVRIRSNEDYYNEHCASLKNVAFLNSSSRNYKGNHAVYDSLSNTYNLRIRMTHEELLIKYEKFRQELLLIDK